jgi:hypothetical protein
VDLDRSIGVEGDQDVRSVAAERLVDRVVDDLPQAVHETARVGRADIHSGTLAARLEALEDQEVTGVVRAVDDGFLLATIDLVPD